MKKNNVFFIGLSLLVFGISLYLISNIILSLILACIIGVIIYRLIPIIKQDNLKYLKINHAYKFCTYFNMQMFSTTNIYEAYKNIEENLPDDFKNFDGNDFTNQLLSLAEEYALNGLSLYCKTLVLYSNQGGDFFKMTNSSFHLIQNTKIYYEKLKAQKKTRLFEILTLYLLWLFVLLFLKLGLASYFDQMSKTIEFQLGMFFILLIGFTSLALTIKTYYHNQIKGLN